MLFPEEPVLPPYRNCRELLSLQKAEVIYDLTLRFANKYLAKGDRTPDPMIQSARSGKQNFLEGSKGGPTSKEIEINLTNVARASRNELLGSSPSRSAELRKNSCEQYVRRIGRTPPQTFDLYREFFDTREYRHLRHPPGQLPARPASPSRLRH